MDKIDIIKFVDKAFNLETEDLAFNENPVLFALYELVASYIYEKYEIKHDSYNLHEMSNLNRDTFFKDRIVNQIYIRINRKDD